MTIKKYQEATAKTAIYPNVGVIDNINEPALGDQWPVNYTDYVYPIMGLMGEVGELANKLKKNIRDHRGHSLALDIKDLSDEIGDVMWYVSQLCTELGIDLETVLESNIAKLKSRKDRGVIGGSRDKR